MVELATSGSSSYTLPQLVSPLAGSTSQMSRLAWSEFYAGEIGELSREGALQIPAIKKARNILVTSIAGAPLRQYRGETEIERDWLHNSASGISPWHRMAATVDDLIFYDWACWAVSRHSDGTILDALRIPYERWAIDDLTGAVTVDGNVVSAEEVIVFPGAGDGGLLATGAQTIKGYKALERAWIGRAQNPIPLVELHQTTDDPLTDGDEQEEEDEIGRLVDEWAAARLSPNGAVGYTPHNIEVKVHGNVSADLFEQGRNAAVLDVARTTGVPASLLDGAQTNASLTYVTTEGKRSEFDALSLPQWRDPIEARLSLDDVAPRGEVIRFDRREDVAVAADPVSAPLED
ncbi:phage portal protein [Microbacterium sp. LWH7-1.2]|uniref:phage portal protein n=1 Tax=Microbacterium sp. LWH7-1.2 TaxID=3135257 RepID=UPI00313983C6